MGNVVQGGQAVATLDCVAWNTPSVVNRNKSMEFEFCQTATEFVLAGSNHFCPVFGGLIGALAHVVMPGS
jgi:hypothetical protein